MPPIGVERRLPLIFLEHREKLPVKLGPEALETHSERPFQLGPRAQEHRAPREDDDVLGMRLRVGERQRRDQEPPATSPRSTPSARGVLRPTPC